MIRSMTAFGSAQANAPTGTVSVELRSVNSRYLDLHFRLPDELRNVETPLRELLSAGLPRGKVEARASFTRHQQTDTASLNVGALRHAADLLASVREVFPDTPTPRLQELLSWPGVQGEPAGADVWNEAVLTAAREALAQLQQAREREGARLAEMIAERAREVQAIVAELEQRMPEILTTWRDRQARKLRDTVDAAFPGGFQHISGAELSERLSHETSLFALRIDVAEELSRLHAHLDELGQIVGGIPASSKTAPAASRKKPPVAGSAGKRLDFLFQEMNREANTLGSKAGAIDMTRAAMDLKLLIEQMREQAQNIE